MKTGERIRSFRRQAGLTLEELAGLVGTSKQTVYRYESGEIENIPRGRIEAIAKVLHQSPAALMGWEGDSLSSYGILSCKRRAVPLLGKIACGQPIYAEEEFCGYMPLGDEIEADFCLRACGDSMIGARIFDGDIVFVKAQDAVENGEIAVVIADGEKIRLLETLCEECEEQKEALTSLSESLDLLNEELRESIWFMRGSLIE